MDASVEFLLENLKQLLVYHVNQIRTGETARDELQNLQDDIGKLNEFKEDVTYKEWKQQIADVVYDAEDIIDTSVTQIAKGRSLWLPSADLIVMKELLMSFRKERVKPLLTVLSEKKTTVRSAKIHVSEIRYILEAAAATHKKRQCRPNYIAGFEDQADELIKHLNSASEKLEIHSIVGKPGHGKTTLAQKIYDDPRITCEFPIQIWVNISKELNMEHVLLTVWSRLNPLEGVPTEQQINHIKECTKMDAKHSKDHADEGFIQMDVEKLIEIVRDSLESEKFLIVIDDIRTTNMWNELKSFLPMDNKSGRVITTTCHKSVAWVSNVMKEPHELRLLSAEKSWELLQYQVFGDLGVVNQELVQVGQTIAKLCQGIPLSLVLIGGILKRTVQWEDVSRSIESILSEEQSWCLGDFVSNGTKTAPVSEDCLKDLSKGTETTPGLETQGRCLEVVSECKDTNPILHKNSKFLDKIISLSYEKLTSELKDCFLYLGMFPEGFDIPVKKLILLWTADGFIKNERSDWSLEQIAQDYLKDLIKLNLVMVGKVRPSGEATICRLHGLVREFCRTKAMFGNLKFFQEIEQSRGVFQPSIKNIMGDRRLCIHSHVYEFFCEKPKVPKASSFLCFPKGPIYLQSKDTSRVINSFSLLRVLDSGSIIFPEFPRKLLQLVCLRYLVLTYVSGVLPEAITNLSSLQTLIVDISDPELEIRGDIWKMKLLRHLMSKATIYLKNDGKGNSEESLRSLGRLSPRSCTLDFANKASALIELAIQGELSTFFLNSDFLEKLENLEKLKLVHDDESALKLPETIRFPPKIKVLSLNGTLLDWEQMSILAKLVSLEELKLKNKAFKGSSCISPRGGFEHLEILLIEQTDLKCWTAFDDSFPKLRYLSLTNCVDLEKVPSELSKSLETLYMEGVTGAAVSSAESIKKAKGKETAGGRAFKLEISYADQRKSLTRDKQRYDGIECGEPRTSTSS